MIRVLIPLLFILGCGGGTNSVFVTSADKERIDVMMTRARIAFDRNKLVDAEKYATQAYNLNTQNQAAAQQLANIYMSLGKVSTLDIATRISSDLNVKDTSSNNKSLASTQATDIFGVLADVVNLVPSDLEKMGALHPAIGASSGQPIAFFNGLDVYYPKDPGSVTDTSSPRYTVVGLRYINKAINILCPFVADTITSGSKDPRDKCVKAKESSAAFHAQVHFSYAMAHFLEAIYFNSILNYSTKPDKKNPSQSGNLFQRVSKIEKLKFTQSNIIEFSDAVVELKSNIDNIMQTDSATSMLTAIMQDFNMAVASLAAIAGFPDSMLAKIQSGLKNIQTIVAKGGSQKTDLSKQTKVLKEQFVSQVATKLGNSIRNLIAQKPDDKEHIAKVCSAFTNMVNAFTTPIKTPDGCPST